MNPFTIVCTTCKTKLKIKKASLIGQIQSCPKCGSMVEITTPKESSPKTKKENTKQSESHTTTTPAAVADAQDTTLSNHAEDAFAEAAALLESDDSKADSSSENSVDSNIPDQVTDASLSSNWSVDKTQLWRNYALVGGGAILSLAFIAVVGNALLTSNDSPDVVENQTTSQVEPNLPENTKENNLENSNSMSNPSSSDISEEDHSLINSDKVDEPKEETNSENLQETDNKKEEPSPFEVTDDPMDQNPFLFKLPGENQDENPTDAQSTAPVNSDKETLSEAAENAKTQINVTSNNSSQTLKIEEDPLFDILGQSFPMFDENILEQDQPENSVPENAVTQPISIPLDATPEIESLKSIDISARLNDSIVGIKLDNIPLDEFVELVSQMSTIPISIDPLALKQANLAANTPIKVNQQNATIKQLLESALSPLGMDLNVEKNQVLLVQPQPQGVSQRVVRYQLNDLIQDDSTIDYLNGLLTTLVQPDSWQQQNEVVQSKIENTSLLVSQTERAHFEALILFEKLRVARGNSHKSRYPAKLFELPTREMQGQSFLNKPITLFYVVKTPLPVILDQLEKRAGIQILVDWASLWQQNLAPTSETIISAENQKFDDLLENWLKPKGLIFA